MKTWQKACCSAVLFFAFCFIFIGYAALTDSLHITGIAHAEPFVYEGVVITDVSVHSSTNVSSESHTRVIPSNLSSTITGTKGQKIVYCISVCNFSKTNTYIYTGALIDAAFSAVSSKLSIVASTDEEGTMLLPNNSAATYTSGTPLAPEETAVIYVTYTLTDDMTAENLLVNFTFKNVMYQVMYLVENETYAIDYVTDNSVAYPVKATGPDKGDLKFSAWVNANAIPMSSFPAGNTNDYTVSAKWEDVYLIIFSDSDGTVLYEENFTESSTAISSEGQAIVNAKLAELNELAALKHMSVSWSSYDIANATGDITVRAIYNYAGYLDMEPVYEEPDDGIVDYYKVLAVDDLPATVVVPGYIGGIPVKVIDRITNIDGDSDWDNYEEDVTTIIIEEGVEVLEHNALSYTPNLTEVHLPNTLTTMGKNTFSRNDIFGNDKKKLVIYFNGTTAEWDAIVKNSDSSWAGGLKNGTVVRCSDAYYELGLFSRWTKKSY